MLKKELTYTDFDGNTVTETCYFNFTKLELIEMESSVRGGYADFLKKAVASKDPTMMYNAYREIIGKAYGKRSEDGKRFLKSPEIYAEFAGSLAEEALLDEMLDGRTQPDAFINAIMPDMSNIRSAGK